MIKEGSLSGMLGKQDDDDELNKLLEDLGMELLKDQTSCACKVPEVITLPPGIWCKRSGMWGIAKERAPRRETQD